MNMSRIPPKSLTIAFGVKIKPSAKIFRLISKLMQITNEYSAIYNINHVNTVAIFHHMKTLLRHHESVNSKFFGTNEHRIFKVY